jgi:hypothetical protein
LSKIIRQEHSKDKLIDNSDVDFSKADGMSEEEIEGRAKSDPDSLIITPASAKKIKPIKRNRNTIK